MNTKKGSATVYDIAQQAGVSPATVSRVFGAAEYPVAEGTRRKVYEAAKRLGYLPRGAAERDAMKTVMVVVPDLVNPYYASLIAGLETSLRGSGMNMLLKCSCGGVEQEARFLAQIDPKTISGLIISPAGDRQEHIAQLLQKKVEAVIIEQDSGLACSKVCFDYEKGGALMTQYLIDRGLREIGFISSPLTRSSRRGVYTGFLRAMKQNGLPVDEAYIKIAQREDRRADLVFESSNGEAQVLSMLEAGKLPRAIFCANDITAMGVLRLLNEKGIKVPEEVSVAGFDNIHYSGMTTPPLTTVDQCTYEMGSMAAELLSGNLADPNRKRVNVMLEPRLVVRGSVL